MITAQLLNAKDTKATNLPTRSKSGPKPTGDRLPDKFKKRGKFNAKFNMETSAGCAVH
jgi:hypothetical protein